MIIAYPKETRKREPLDPSQYRPVDPPQPWNTAGQGSVTLAAPTAPPPGMVAQQPAQAPTAAPQPQVVQPQAPAPIAQPAQAQPQQQAPGDVVTPMFAPTTTPGQQQQIQQQYERSGLQAPPAPQPTLAPPPTQADRTAEYGRVHDIQVKAVEKGRADRAAETDKRRVSMGLKPLTPKAPEAAPQGHTSAIPLDAPEAVSKAAEADGHIQRHEKLGAEIDKIIAAGGKPKQSLLDSYAKAGKQAATRYAALSQEHLAKQETDKQEADAKSKKDAATTQRSIESHQWAQESHAAGKTTKETAAADKKRNQDMTKMLGAAQDAAKDGRFDDAEEMAEAGQKNANTPAEAAAFNAIRKEVQDAKAAIQKEAKIAATTKAAAVLKPKVDVAKQLAKDAEKALDATHKAIATIRAWKKKNPPLKTDRQEDADYRAIQEQDEQKLIDQEPGQRAEMERTRKEYWRLDQEHANVSSGVQAPAAQPAAKPAPAAGAQAPAAYGNRADGTPKGNGFLGPLPMTDGSGETATEVSMGVDFGNGEIEIPTLVPTLTPQERDYVLAGHDPRGNQGVHEKAIAHARQRIAAGKSPFATPYAQMTDAEKDAEALRRRGTGEI